MYFIDEYEIVNLNYDDNLLINLLNGAADIINEQIKRAIISKKVDNLPKEVIELMLKRHYIFENKSSKENFELELIKHLDILELKELPNFLIIPTYDCNLRCPYCFEGNYTIGSKEVLTIDYKFINKIFESIDKICNNFQYDNSQDITITLMGGEPLLSKNYEIIKYILELINKKNYSLKIVTNGFELEKYIPLLEKTNIKSIQITIDGPRDIHNSRRIGKHGEKTFNKILDNVKQCLERKIKVYIRINVDNSNINFLPDLATQLSENLNNSNYLIPYVYLLQDGGCAGNSNIIDEIYGLKKIIELEKQYPILKMFHKTFHGVNLFESIVKNDSFKPSLRNCSSAKNQYIFDCKGNIYKCWFGVGNDSYKIGTFIPELQIESAKKNMWLNRTVYNMEKCKSCKYKFICGGGCIVRANSVNHDMNEGNCPNFKEIFNTVFSYKYAKKQV